MARENPFSVYVGNLPPEIRQSHFELIFPECKITGVRMIRDKETDAFKGFAYVDFEDEESLQAALKTDGAMVETYKIRVNHAHTRRGGRGGSAPRGGPSRDMGNGYGRGGYANRGNQDNWAGRGRSTGRMTDMGPRGGMRGGYNQRPSYHPPGIPRESITTEKSHPEGDSSSSRPRLNLKPRTAPLDSSNERQLSERSRAIFGLGRPRDPSPVKPSEDSAESTSSDWQQV